MSQIGMCGVPPLILKHLVSSVVSLAQLVSPSVALPAELVILFLTTIVLFPITIPLVIISAVNHSGHHQMVEGLQKVGLTSADVSHVFSRTWPRQRNCRNII